MCDYSSSNTILNDKYAKRPKCLFYPVTFCGESVIIAYQMLVILSTACYVFSDVT